VQGLGHLLVHLLAFSAACAVCSRTANWKTFVSSTVQMQIAAATADPPTGSGAAAAAATAAAAEATPAGWTVDPSRRQIFVVGNEAADVDSLVSAYAMAELLDGAQVQGIALAQIPREEFRLRGDALKLFREAGVELLKDGSPMRLCFWDEVCRETISNLHSRSLALTDHNKRTAQVAELFDDNHVELILDHHKKTDCYPHARAHIDEGLGSACTLVVEHFLTAGVPISRQLGTLLAGVILLDTRNFCPQEGKGTPRDQAALDKIAEHIPSEGATLWYKALMVARLDVSHLSVRELALVDTKLQTIPSDGSLVAFSSLPTTLAQTCERAGNLASLVTAVQALAASRQYTLVVLFCAKDSAGRKAVAFVPLDDSDGSRGVELSAALVRQLCSATPGEFPEVFASSPLFATQGLLEHGFEMKAVEDFLPYLAFSLRGTVSRKTLMPYAMAALAL